MGISINPVIDNKTNKIIETIIKSPHLANIYPINFLGEKTVLNTSTKISNSKSKDLHLFNSHNRNFVRGISISLPRQGMKIEKPYMTFHKPKGVRINRSRT